MHWLVASRVNDEHDSVLVAYLTIYNIFIFLGSARHSNICYNVATISRHRISLLTLVEVSGGACLLWLNGGGRSAQTRWHGNMSESVLVGGVSSFMVCGEYGVKEGGRHGEGEVGTIQFKRRSLQ